MAKKGEAPASNLENNGVYLLMDQITYASW